MWVHRKSGLLYWIKVNKEAVESVEKNDTILYDSMKIYCRSIKVRLPGSD